MNRSIIRTLAVLGILAFPGRGSAIDIKDAETLDKVHQQRLKQSAVDIKDAEIEVVTVSASRADGFDAGTSVTLKIYHDSLIFARIDEDRCHLTGFSDDTNLDLIRTGKSIERRSNMFSTRTLNGIDFSHAKISRDGHSISVGINSMAAPRKGSNTLTVTGLLAFFVEDNEQSVDLPFELTFGVGGI